MYGLQLWVALPLAFEEAAASFHHYPGTTLPERDHGGVRLRVLAGTAYEMTSPVEILSPLFYADAVMAAGGAPLDGKRFIDWNFVSSSKERIAQARSDWQEGRFPKVPGDDVEFIPLPG